MKTPSQLYNTKECDEICLLPNGESLKMQLKGNSDLVVRVDGDPHSIKLGDVYYSENLPWDILSYGKIE